MKLISVTPVTSDKAVWINPDYIVYLWETDDPTPAAVIELLTDQTVTAKESVDEILLKIVDTFPKQPSFEGFPSVRFT